jgi:hypothetical protein
MRYNTCAISCALIFAAAGAGRLCAVEGGRSISAGDAERRIEAILSEPLRKPLAFINTPLSTIMNVLSEEYDIPILFDKLALEAVAASPDAEVTFNIRNVKLRTALELMLRDVPDVTSIVDHEVLLITTEDEAAKRLEVRVYRVDDLLVPNPHDGPPIGADYDELIDLVIATIERDSWTQSGTGEGEIKPFDPGMLVVSQTHRVHEQIDQFFATLRTVKGAVLADVPPEDGDAIITRSVRIYDKSLAEDAAARDAVRDVLVQSANWQSDDEQTEKHVSLHVLPTQVIVRHNARVVRQVMQTVRELSIDSPLDGHFCGEEGRGGREPTPAPAESQRGIIRRGGF